MLVDLISDVTLQYPMELQSAGLIDGSSSTSKSQYPSSVRLCRLIELEERWGTTGLPVQKISIDQVSLIITPVWICTGGYFLYPAVSTKNIGSLIIKLHRPVTEADSLSGLEDLQFELTPWDAPILADYREFTSCSVNPAEDMVVFTYVPTIGG